MVMSRDPGSTLANPEIGPAMYRDKLVHRLTLSYSTVEPLSNLDTNGADESVIVSEVSSFQRLNKSGTWSGKRCPV